MQIYAFDENQHLVKADSAQKQRNYLCIECQGNVRLRGGIHRQNHFYHLNPNQSCRLSGKSMAHLQVQGFLQRLLPPGDCCLEVRFPQINRIADAVWASQKLIFEIQCSGITAQEVMQRNKDYQSLGYQVIWILHDSFYNQRRVTAAELFLRDSPFYFTDMDADGRGKIYDQFDVVYKGLRRHCQRPLLVDLSQPKKPSKNTKKALFAMPKLVHQRFERWPLFFKGDLIDSSESLDFGEDLQAEKEWLEVKAQVGKTSHLARKIVYNVIVRPYNLLFQMLLERLCR